MPVMRPFMKAPARGAATSVYRASAPDLEQVTGRFFAGRKPRKSGESSYYRTAAARLWQVSADAGARRCTARWRRDAVHFRRRRRSPADQVRPVRPVVVDDHGRAALVHELMVLRAGGRNYGRAERAGDLHRQVAHCRPPRP